jgi:DNA polymerase-3 subunit delta'
LWYDNTVKKITKDDISYIINNFNLSSKEKSGKKIYVIKNIDKCNTQVCNSLLKYIEEPQNDVYAIFTCSNIKNVLQTIVSRCQTILIKTNENSLKKIKESLNIDDNQWEVIKVIYHDLDDLTSDIENETLKNSWNFSNSVLSVKETNIKKYKILSDDFKKKSWNEILLILKILLIKNKNEELSELIDMLKLNPIKVLLFDKIVQVVNSN